MGYEAKLVVEDELIPDPFKTTGGWLGEKDGVAYWPTTLYPDIYFSLSFHPSELKASDLGDYKVTKAYSYYTDGWLHPLYYHPLTERSKYCILKTTCRQYQRITDTSHKLWICISKANGKVMRAHSTCMAGFSQTCNHVAAALFRIEAPVRMGLNNQPILYFKAL